MVKPETGHAKREEKTVRSPVSAFSATAKPSERVSAVSIESASRLPRSVYPTLQLLEDEGLVEPTAEGGKKIFHLTPAGEEIAAQGEPEPWSEVAGDAAQVALGQVVRGLLAAFQQVARTGTPDQLERTRVVLNDARKALYGILAEDEPVSD